VPEKFDKLTAETLTAGAKFLLAEKFFNKTPEYKQLVWRAWLISICVATAVTGLVHWLMHLANSTMSIQVVIAIDVVLFLVSCWIVRRWQNRFLRSITNDVANKIAQDPRTTLRGLAAGPKK
jgi:hypothetical protein